MNKVILVGRFTRDPDLRTTTTGKSVATFSLAIDRRYKQEGQPTADFFNIVAWGRQAEVICQYLGKGRQIALSGHLQARSYDGKDGVKRYVTEVVLEDFDFIGSKNDGGGNGYNQSPAEGPPQTSTMNDMPLDFDDDFQLIADDDEVPF